MVAFSLLIQDPATIHLFIAETLAIISLLYSHNICLNIYFNFIMIKCFFFCQLVAFIFYFIFASIRAKIRIQHLRNLVILCLFFNIFISLHLFYLQLMDLHNSKLVMTFIVSHFFIFKKKNSHSLKIFCFLMFWILNLYIQRTEFSGALIILRNFISAIIISLGFAIRNDKKSDLKLISYEILKHSSKAIFAFNSSFSLTFLSKKCKKYIKKRIIPFNLDLKLLFKKCFVNKLSDSETIRLNKFFELFKIQVLVVRNPQKSEEVIDFQIYNLKMLSDIVKYIYPSMINETLSLFFIEILKSVKKHSILLNKEQEKNSLNILRTISHDLRTPIIGMIGSLTMLNGTLIGESKNLLNIAFVSAKLLYNNINLMIDYSLIMHKQFKPLNNMISLQTIRNRLEELFSSKAKMNNIYFSIFFDNTPFEFQIEHERIVQILINLVNNSINFTTKGFVEVQMKFKNLNLSFGVKDSGIGMSQILIDVLLGKVPFSAKLDESESKGQFGIGIKTSNMILKLLGSELKISSTINEGTSISFDLKLRPEQIKKSILSEKKAPILNYKEKNKHHFFAPEQFGGSSRKKVQEDMFKFSIISPNASSNERRNDPTLVIKNIENKLDIKIMKEEEVSDYEEDNKKYLINQNVVSHTLNISKKDFIPKKPLFRRKPPFNLSFNIPNNNFLPNTNTQNNDPKMEKARNIILVVDDEPFNRSVLKSLITKNFNLKVSEAKNGVDAIEKVKKHLDLVILVFMDISMPIMDGYQATAEIRKILLKFKKSLPIIALTSFPAEIEKAKCLQAGMNDFMNKPITQRQLISCFEQHINFVQKITTNN